jgi:sarcosine oxidase subunit beta
VAELQPLHRIADDIGGTFTDGVMIDPSGQLMTAKVLSTPDDPSRGFFHAVEVLLGQGSAASPSVEAMGHATTVATNAIIEGKLEPIAMITTAGFRDILEIARQNRPHLYDFFCEKPEPLVPLNPLIEGPILGGLYFRGTAQVNPFKVTTAFAAAAQRLGAEVRIGAAVEGVEVELGRLTQVRTTREVIRTPWLVNAAGAYAPALGQMVGTVHEVVPRRGQIMVLEGVPNLPATAVTTAGQLVAKHLTQPGSGSAEGIPMACAYTFKPRSGTVLLGSTYEFAGYDTRCSLGGLAGVSAYAARLMPALTKLQVLRTWAGLRPYSASGPILGRAGGPEGYVALTGHGGDGIALAPITGLYAAAMLTQEPSDVPLDQFLERHQTAPV